LAIACYSWFSVVQSRLSRSAIGMLSRFQRFQLPALWRPSSGSADRAGSKAKMVLI
jgi:hypothetical protein